VTYRWWVFLHILGVFAFLLGHGVSVAVTFRLRRERDPARINALLELSGSSLTMFFYGLLVLVGAGVVAGFIGKWWGQGWIWTAIGVLVAISVAMSVLARPYYKKVRLVTEALASGSEAVTEDQFVAVLRSPLPLVIAVIGYAGLLVIVWLMMFKPF
jgi:formate hydrogenlyase subunit 3/multisubunit Na+/H+ antiporter MnhD subunit